jgi:class 3 adenylate cyclase/CHASE2 domain-containing sensor protein
MTTQRAVSVIALALAGLAFTLALSKTVVGNGADYFTYDRLLRWRAQAGKSPELDPRLLILEVDEKTRQKRKLPVALWLPYYAQALEGAFSAGAVMVGFDIIPTYDPPDLFLPFFKVLQTHPNKVKMVSFWDREQKVEVLPGGRIRAVIGDHNMGLANVTRDPDGIYRRQYLKNAEIGKPGEETTRPFLSTLLYEELKPEGTVPDEVLINFVGPPGTVPRVSFGDVLDWVEEGRLEKLEEVFKDKVVLIGGTAKIDQDFVETPFPAKEPMPGVEMHANILNTLLLDQPIQETNAWPLLFIALLPLAWCSLEKPVYASSALCLLLGLGWTVGGFFALINDTLISPLGSGLCGILATFLCGYLFRFNTVEKEQRHIRSVFGRYVSPDVMEAMLEVPEDHKPELAKRQRVTVMFSDINDFSTACEKLEPEEVTRQLNVYFDEMTKIIYQHQGTIIRFIGDEFMVLFGAPKANEKSEEMAVLSAVRMVKRLADMKTEDPSGERGFYEVKIGIHVGDMILTSIGNEIRSDYNCIGDSTNMAARVLSLTKPLSATVLISSDVKKRVENCPELSFKDLGVHPVKGRAGEVQVFEAMLSES